MPDKARVLAVDTFSLPEYLGTIKHLHKGSSDKVVVHIQDAHCNYAAQNRVSDIISFLSDEYGLQVINLEGGAGPYDLSIFTDIYNSRTRSRVADYFVRWGEVNGAELFAIKNPDKSELWGVEDSGLYMKNLNVYRDSLSYKKDVNDHLKDLDRAVSNLKRRIFNENLIRVDDEYSRYKAGEVDFKDYLLFLIDEAHSWNINVKKYPNIFLLQQTIEEEDKIDFKKANTQREILIDRMENILSRRETRELVSRSVQFKNKVLPKHVYYDYLIRKARECNISMDEYPEFQKYIVYIALYQAVDKLQVMREITDMENEIKGFMFDNETQKRLDVLFKNLVLMKNIFNIAFTKEDYRYYKENPRAFDISNYIDFVNEEAPRYKLRIKLDPEVKKLDAYRDRIFKFYEYSFQRDDAFIDNMKFEDVGGTGVNGSILMTGGFHTENLCELFKENDISYVSIIPNFRMPEGYESPYFSLLSGRTMSPVEHVMDTSFSLIQVASLLNSLGVEADPERSEKRKQLFDLGVMAVKRMVEAGEEGFMAFELTDGRMLLLGLNKGTPSLQVVTDAEFESPDFSLKVNSIDQFLSIDPADLYQLMMAFDRVGRTEELDRISPLRYADAGSEIISGSRFSAEETGIKGVYDHLAPGLEDGEALPEIMHLRNILGALTAADMDSAGEKPTRIQIVADSGLTSAYVGEEAISIPAEASREDQVRMLLEGVIEGSIRGGRIDGLEVSASSIAKQAARSILNGDLKTANYLLEKGAKYEVFDEEGAIEGTHISLMDAEQRLQAGVEAGRGQEKSSVIARAKRSFRNWYNNTFRREEAPEVDPEAPTPVISRADIDGQDTSGQSQEASDRTVKIGRTGTRTEDERLADIRAARIQNQERIDEIDRELNSRNIQDITLEGVTTEEYEDLVALQERLNTVRENFRLETLDVALELANLKRIEGMMAEARDVGWRDTSIISQARRDELSENYIVLLSMKDARTAEYVARAFIRDGIITGKDKTDISRLLPKANSTVNPLLRNPMNISILIDKLATKIKQAENRLNAPRSYAGLREQVDNLRNLMESIEKARETNRLNLEGLSNRIDALEAYLAEADPELLDDMMRAKGLARERLAEEKARLSRANLALLQKEVEMQGFSKDEYIRRMEGIRKKEAEAKRKEEEKKIRVTADDGTERVIKEAKDVKDITVKMEAKKLNIKRTAEEERLRQARAAATQQLKRGMSMTQKKVRTAQEQESAQDKTSVLARGPKLTIKKPAAETPTEEQEADDATQKIALTLDESAAAQTNVRSYITGRKKKDAEFVKEIEPLFPIKNLDVKDEHFKLDKNTGQLGSITLEVAIKVKKGDKYVKEMKKITVDLSKKIGSGGRSDVYKATVDGNEKEQYAFKVFRVDEMADVAANKIDLMKSFDLVNYQIGSKHDQVLVPHDIGHAKVLYRSPGGMNKILEEDYYYMVEELIPQDAVSLKDYIDPNNLDPNKRPKLSEEEKMQLVSSISDALKKTSRAGVIHADIKPANIMVMKNDKGELFAKLFDWDTAVYAPSEDPNVPGAGVAYQQGDLRVSQNLASPTYWSISNAGGQSVFGGDVGIISGEADVFALAYTLFNVLTGEYPFTFYSEDQLREYIMTSTNSDEKRFLREFFGDYRWDKLRALKEKYKEGSMEHLLLRVMAVSSGIEGLKPILTAEDLSREIHAIKDSGGNRPGSVVQDAKIEDNIKEVDRIWLDEKQYKARVVDKMDIIKKSSNMAAGDFGDNWSTGRLRGKTFLEQEIKASDLEEQTEQVKKNLGKLRAQVNEAYDDFKARNLPDPDGFDLDTAKKTALASINNAEREVETTYREARAYIEQAERDRIETARANEEAAQKQKGTLGEGLLKRDQDRKTELKFKTQSTKEEEDRRRIAELAGEKIEDDDKTPKISLIGELFDREGNLIEEGGFTLEEEGGQIVLGHERMAEDVRVGILRDVPEAEMDSISSGIDSLIESSGALSKLEKTERDEIVRLADLFGTEGMKVKAIQPDDRLMGYFDRRSNTLYLNEELLRPENTLSLLHELGERYAALPEVAKARGLTNHTYMRGAGKDVRDAYKAILAVQAGAFDNIGITEFIGLLNDNMPREMTNSEIALIEHNAGLYGDLSVDGKLGLEDKSELFYGLQDKLDYSGNMALTRKINVLMEDLRKGTLNIVLTYNGNLRAAPAQQGIAQKMSRKFRKMGTTVRAGHYMNADDMLQAINDAYVLSKKARNINKYGKVYVDCVREDDLRELRQLIFEGSIDKEGKRVPSLREKVENGTADERETWIVDNVVIGKGVDPDLDLSRHPVNEAGIISVATLILNRKRLVDDFNVPYDSPMMVDMTKKLLSGLASSQFIEKSEKEIKEMSPEELDAIMDQIYSGTFAVRLTRVRWEEISEWAAAQEEVYRSL